MNRQSAALEQEWLAIDLSGAFIRRADLSGASLNEANFSGADCTNANFRGADFEGAVLEGTILKGADLREARNLTKQQIQSAVIDSNTLLPAGML
jgi:uncharacterized protein YjbI with pentapeptide repeats